MFGLEGTIAGLDNRGTLLNTVFGAGLDDRFSWRADWMATITGRAGYAVSNNLFYVKGGYAGVNNRLSVVDAVPLTGSGSQTQWHNGWTVGAGWEYGITRNWIVGLEYDYAAFENKNYQLAGASAGIYTFAAKPRDIQSVVVSSELQVRLAAGRAVLSFHRSNRQDKAPAPAGAFFVVEQLKAGVGASP